MSQIDSVNSERANARILILAAAAVALAIVLPLLVKVATTHTQAQHMPGPDLVADLTGGPIGGQTPHGSAQFFAGGGNAGAHLFVEIENVNLDHGTHLNVFLNADNIGMIVLDNLHHGFLVLPHSPQDPPPVVNAGDVMSITPGNVPGGNTEILSGTFQEAPTPSPRPTHTPFPSPTHQPFQTPTPHGTPTGSPVPPVHLFAPLTGDPIGGVTPRGLGQYESWNAFRELDVFVSFVNLPEGTSLDVAVAGTGVGSIMLHNHAGLLHLNNGNAPTVAVGDALTVSGGTGDGNNIILSGMFSDTPPPFPTPTPRASPTPHGTPTPHPTPGPAHAFAANLDGDQEVPPVTTDGHGHGFIILNHDETEIHVFVGSGHLSSDVTATTINGPAMPGANGPVIFTLDAPPRPMNTVPFQTFAVTAEQVAQLRANLWYFNIATEMNPDGEIRGQIHSINHRDDFDGDGLSEISVMRAVDSPPENAAFTWYILNSSDNTVTSTQIGHPGDVNVQGDYDGDGTADIAMFTPSTGIWQLRLSATGQTQTIQWGTNGDVPLVGDYDGDGINDLAVFRPSDGNWYVRRSVDGQTRSIHWGQNGDRPVSGDFDGDGSNDLAIFRPSSGNWYILRSSDSGMTAMHWGMTGDRPVAGDFDGDGMSDVAVFRPSEGNWYIDRSSDNTLNAVHFGMDGDIPVPCEFDGDGNSDVAVFRPSDGNWYILRSSDNTLSAFHFGISTDLPITTAYAPE